MKPAPREFLDTNILVYAFSLDARSVTARALLSRGCVVGLQGLNEFANVAHRKLKMSWAETRDALAAIRVLCAEIAPMDMQVHETALGLAERVGSSFHDSTMLAAALRAKCNIFWSEDLQGERLIEGRLRIRNPFAAGA